MALSEREQRKWDSLQDAGQSRIDRILSAVGTEADVTALSNILTEQHELAGQLFDQGVEDAVTTANAIVKRMDEERVAKGKKALTDRAQDRAFQRVFKDVLASSIQDILGQIHDEFEAQDRRARERVEEALSRIRNSSRRGGLPPAEQGPSPAGGEAGPAPQRRSFWERFRPRPEGTQDAEPTEGRRSLLDRIFRRRTGGEERERRTVLQVIRDAAKSTKDKVGALYQRVRGRNAEDDEERRASIWMRKLRTLFSPFKKLGQAAKGGTGKMSNLLKMLGAPLMAALMNPQLIESITDAVSKYLNFDQISAFVSSMWEESKKIGSDTLDSVIAKIKSFFGSDKKTSTVPATKKTDPLTAPKLKGGPLDSRITPAEAARDLPRRESQLEAAKRALTAAETAYKASPSVANKKVLEGAQQSVIRAQLMVDQFKGRAAEGTSVLPPAEVSREQAAAVTAVTDTGEVVMPKQTSASQADGGTGKQTSPVSPAAVLSNSSVAPNQQSTEVIGDMPKYVPGVAVENLETQKVEEQKDMRKGAALSQVGIGSFGFDSNDSAMNILNLGMLT